MEHSKSNIDKVLNIMYAFQMVSLNTLGEVKHDDVYIAYLPMAHVLEFLAETAFALLGILFGQHSQNQTTKVKKGFF